MDVIISLLFLLLIAALIKPDAAIFDKIPILNGKGNGIRRLLFFVVWFVLTIICTFVSNSSKNTDKVAADSPSEMPKSDYVVCADSATVILKGQDTLRFDGKGNIEWTAVGMNDGSSLLINIELTQSVGLYPASVKFDKANYDGLVYGGFKFYEGEYGAVGLYDFKGEDGTIRVGKANDHGSVITQEDYKHLQSAIEIDAKTQIKPLQMYDIKSLVSAVKVYVQNVTEGKSQDTKREYTISDGDEAFNAILNGVYPDDNN